MINYHSPDWVAIKKVLLTEREDAIKHLIKEGHDEVTYAQWRGRVSLINKLLDEEHRKKPVTE